MYHRQTLATVKLIRKWYREGVSQVDLALCFDTCQSNIHYIVTRATWP
jgi:hypothetical protein